MIPVVIFAGGSGSGKTTLVEALIRELKSRGLRVAAIKHSGHQVRLDREGSDSSRFSRAGADITVVSGGGQLGVFRNVAPDTGVEDLVAGHISGVDLVLVEGHKDQAFPKIVVSRREVPDDITDHRDRDVVAFVADYPIDSGLPLLPLDNPSAVADFIVRRFLTNRT